MLEVISESKVAKRFTCYEATGIFVTTIFYASASFLTALTVYWK